MFEDCIRTNDPTILARWHKICADQRRERIAWVRQLREQGIKMAHPDDGWVDRKSNYLTPCYPTFDDDALPGDLIALGDPSKHRVVKILKIAKSPFMHQARIYFEEHHEKCT